MIVEMVERWLQAIGMELSPAGKVAMARQAAEVQKWNRWAGLTRITEPEAVAAKHFIDALLPLQFLSWGHTETIVDVGSGGGFPGIPLAAVTGCPLVLIESNQRRAQFLQYLVECLDMLEAEVVPARAEETGKEPGRRESYGVVVSRAVAPLAVLAELCVPLLRTGGLWVAWKGPSVGEELPKGEEAAAELGISQLKVHRAFLPWDYGERRVVEGRKEGRTPERYPRKPGLAHKRPLGTKKG